MDIVAVYQGLANNAAVLSGLNCFPYVPDSVPEPCFYVGELEINYLETFGTDDELTITCRVLVARSDDGSGQANLAQYLKHKGPLSIKAALEAAPTLGGACDDLVVRRMRGHRLYTVGETTYLGAEITVTVIGSE